VVVQKVEDGAYHGEVRERENEDGFCYVA